MTAADTTAAEKAVADAKAKVDAAAAEVKAASEKLEKLEIAVSNAKAKLTELEVVNAGLPAELEKAEAAYAALATAQENYNKARKAFEANMNDEALQKAMVDAKNAMNTAQAGVAGLRTVEEIKTDIADTPRYIEIQKGTLSYAEEALDAFPGVGPAQDAYDKAVAELDAAQKALDALKGQASKVDPKADPKAEKPAPKADPKKDAEKKADPKAEKKADPKKEVKKADAKKLANSGVDAGAAAGGAALLLLAGGAFVAYRKFA
ncbi:hypothetical protein [Actinotignum sanguinis]|uniref:hypothetical protein n=1 Tax=Actinotignum sanguinis TaxID=1445614 RepID=UPI00254E2367|nr:hypothetical protein [Actinotignum sanguinis]MDK8511838.1 hypothetical protein [Actinotignum sanguinis]MDK8518535.1 hypothetical protein [Actinotignum sanguinis]MDK8749500.1 hypothetical protein [Actinotignum sanguinis]